MAQKTEQKESDSSRRQSAASKEKQKNNTNIYLAVAVVVIAIVAFSAFLYLRQAGQTTANNGSLSTFKSNFFSAKHVGIYVNYPNSTLFSESESCATKIIELITENKTNHVAPSAISFYVFNETSCTYVNSLANTSSKSVNASTSFCVNQSDTNPSIFINYSSINGTTITPTKLSFHGNYLYLYQCSIAYELT
jgi:hypothetical protein